MWRPNFLANNKFTILFICSNIFHLNITAKCYGIPTTEVDKLEINKVESKSSATSDYGVDSLLKASIKLKKDKNLKSKRKKLIGIEGMISRCHPIQYDTNKLLLKKYRAALVNVAYVQSSEFSEYNKAIKLYSMANKIDRIINDSKYDYWIKNPLANIYARVGDYDRAIYYYNSLISTFNKDNQLKKLPKVLLNLAIAYSFTNNKSLAIETCSNLLKLGQVEITDRINARILLCNMFLPSNEYPKVENQLLITEALLIEYRKQSLVNNSLLNYYKQLAEFQLINAKIKLSSNNNAAFDSLSNLATLSLTKAYPNEDRREFGKLYYQFGKALLEAGFIEKAKTYADKTILSVLPEADLAHNNLPADSLFYPENTIMEGLMLKAQIAEKEADYRLAINAYKKAMKIDELLRERFAFEESTLISVKENRSFIDGAIDNLYKLKNSISAEEFYAELNYFLQKSKANYLREKRKVNKAISKLSQKEKDKLNSLNNKIENLERPEGNNTNYLTLVDKRKAYLDSISGHIMASDKITFNNYIEYVITDNYTYGYKYFDGDKYFARLLPSDSLYTLIDQFKKSYSDNSISTDQLFSDFYKYLILPFGELPETFKVITDKEIATLPFESFKKKNGEWLLENHNISYHFNSTYDFEKYEDLKTVCVSPSYGEEQALYAYLFRDSLSPLAGAAYETRSIAELLEGNHLSGENANKDSFMKSVADASVVHFAGHAIMDSLDNAFLAFAAEPTEDSQLYINELDNANLQLNLINLSACNTSSGKVREGEGTFSLARAFHAAGAESVISSLWKIPDGSAAIISVEFYKQLLKGKSKDEALRAAKLHYITSVDDEYKHPKYWAGIILHGDTVPLFNTSLPMGITLFSFGLILGLFVVGRKILSSIN